MNATTLNHPTHGPLTIGEKLPGTRTYVCRTESGEEVRLSSRAINQLSKPAAPALSLDTANLAEAVRAALAAMPDSLERVQVAKEIWHLADQYVEERAV